MLLVTSQIAVNYDKLIAQAVQELKDALALGVCGDFAEYKKQCGRIQGLEDALAIFEEACKKAQARS